MEDTNLGKSLDNGKADKEELEKHLPEWFILLRKLVAEYLKKQGSHKTVPELINKEERAEESAHG